MYNTQTIVYHFFVFWYGWFITHHYYLHTGLNNSELMYKKIMYLPDMGYLRTLFTYALCMSTLLSPHNDNFSAAVKFRWKIYCKRSNTPFRRWFAFGCRWKTTAFDTPATSR